MQGRTANSAAIPEDVTPAFRAAPWWTASGGAASRGSDWYVAAVPITHAEAIDLRQALAGRSAALAACACTAAEITSRDIELAAKSEAAALLWCPTVGPQASTLRESRVEGVLAARRAEAEDWGVELIACFVDGESFDVGAARQLLERVNSPSVGIGVVAGLDQIAGDRADGARLVRNVRHWAEQLRYELAAVVIPAGVALCAAERARVLQLLVSTEFAGMLVEGVPMIGPGRPSDAGTVGMTGEVG